MNDRKKGYNWKARQVVQTKVDNSATTKIKIDPRYSSTNKHDESNLLAIPSKKRKTVKVKKVANVTRILSKKQRKHLEKIVDRKKKKENRTALLGKISENQASVSVVEQLNSIAHLQSKGLKGIRQGGLLKKRKHPSNLDSDDDQNDNKLSSIKGSNKLRRLLVQQGNKLDPSVVDFDESDSSDSDEGGSTLESSSGDEASGQTDKDQDKPSDVLEKDDKASNERLDDVMIVEDSQVDSKESCQDETNKPKPVVSKPAVFVPVSRPPGVQEARLKLPILAEEQVIMEAIQEHPVVVLSGETGSGKTTQVPQFLYEAGYATGGKMIAVTEPRRVAAISMSKRVAEEMGLTSREVSYLIRFEGNTTADTKIKFMTDGVLLKEVQSDFLLTRYSVVILDEAHERSASTDILIGLLSRIVRQRDKQGDPLKLIIMSATLRERDFTENKRLFRNPPPALRVETRQFPVTLHFAKRTPQDYLSEAYRKTCKIHSENPSGGILIFVTGQREVNSLVRKLRRAFPLKRARSKRITDVSPSQTEGRDENDKVDDAKEGSSADDDEEEELMGLMKKAVKKSRRRTKQAKKSPPEINLDDYVVVPNEVDWEPDVLGEDEDMSEDEEDSEMLVGLSSREPLWVLPLYSQLSSRQQARVFQTPPARLCVVATNIAETSLTIPDIKYVVDTGRVKTRLYDRLTGVSTFAVTWTSKAAANQRAGRAGRTGPGHCYRLYSSAVFVNHFDEFSVPDIQRKPVDDLVLQMKVMHITKVVNFPFPSPLNVDQLITAERRLTLLGALEKPKSDSEEFTAKVTPLGRSMAAFPVAPRFAKMLTISSQRGLEVLSYTVLMVAALSVPEVLLEEPLSGEPSVDSKRWALIRRKWASYEPGSIDLGDVMVLISAILAAERAASTGELERFCDANRLRHKAVLEVRRLRLQLTAELNLSVPSLELCVDPKMKPPGSEVSILLRQIILSGFPDHVARKIDTSGSEDSDKFKGKRVYRCEGMEDLVYLHRASVLFKDPPDWVVYQEVYETNKLYMRGVTRIEPEYLPRLAPSLCSLSEPLKEPCPYYSAKSGKMFCFFSGTFGRQAWKLPLVEVEFPAGSQVFKWLARFLLDGSMCPELSRFRPLLLSAPESMTNSWTNLQVRTKTMLKELMDRGVNSRSMLLAEWEIDPSYLLNAYKLWLPRSAHGDLVAMWPPTKGILVGNL
uniref:RNA helicase n=1 Tax=Timema bartmani TaxID=61472 RepID=A0A7R9F2A1_9NEOP|nr:unnamed protein product [Timema bartmani]